MANGTRLLNASRTPARSPFLAVGWFAAAFALCGCPDDRFDPQEKTPALGDVIEIVPPEFFSGKWMTVNTDPPMAMTIDMQKGKLTSIYGNEEQIVDLVPVDRGYALLLYDPVHTDHPDGLYTALPLMRTSQDSLVLIESPDRVTVFHRAKPESE